MNTALAKDQAAPEWGWIQILSSRCISPHTISYKFSPLNTPFSSCFLPRPFSYWKHTRLNFFKGLDYYGLVCSPFFPRALYQDQSGLLVPLFLLICGSSKTTTHPLLIKMSGWESHINLEVSVFLYTHRHTVPTYQQYPPPPFWPARSPSPAHPEANYISVPVTRVIYGEIYFTVAFICLL